MKLTYLCKITEHRYTGLCLLLLDKSDKRSRRIFCSSEGILGGLLDGSCMGLSHQKDQAIIRSLEFLAISSTFTPFSREGERTEHGVNN